MARKRKKIIRITTVPASLRNLLEGQLRFMSNYYEVIAISSKGNGNQLEKLAVREGIPTVEVEMTRKITPIKDIMSIIKLFRLFKKEKPFIVHSHTPKAGTTGMIAARLANVPHRLHTIAGLPLMESTGIKRLVLNLVERITYSCATKIYPNSFGLEAFILQQRFAKKSKIKVLANGSSNGIDTNLYSRSHFDDRFKQELNDKLGISENDFVFIFAGRLVKDKGINELVSAFNRLSEERKNIKLLLVGSDEKLLDPLAMDTIEIMENNPNIILPGWVDDVRPYYSISNALVFPSYREGFPNVVMQACSMELPCIVSDINGCNEIIKPYVNGIIIPVKDEDAIYKSMTYILDNKEEVKKMGESSRKIIMDNYEREYVWSKILEEYEELK